MSSRKTISPRVRFEVFKRDKFACQYCGARAPEVVLHADHVRPVADGGDNDILNLMTSCAKCNGGKGAVPLSDAQAVDRQIDHLAELEDRRQQIEMMLEWRDELQGLANRSVEMIADTIAARGKFSINENGRSDIRRWLKRYSVSELLAAADESFDYYLRFEGNEPTSKSWETAFIKIPAVADMARQELEKPYIKRLLYVQGIIRKRTGAARYRCFDYLEHVHLCGLTLDDMERRAKAISATVDEFEGPIDAWLESIGRPY